MSTGLIVVIVVVAVIIIAALLFALTRGRRVAAERARERELSQRRRAAVSEHREAAQSRVGAAEEAEHRARVAGAVAERERAEARLHEERARSHELGLHDDELMQQQRTTRTRDEAVADRTTGDRVHNGNGAERDVVAEEAPARGGRIHNGDR
jgi:FtsZ-interacting cell division protein ZipA